MVVIVILFILCLPIIFYLYRERKKDKKEIVRLISTIKVLTSLIPPYKCCKPVLITSKKILKVATNHIIIDFGGCSPTPFGGYIIKYRPVGDVGPYRDAPGNPYTTSPAEWDDTLDAIDTQYEGYIQSDCGDGNLGEQVPFETTTPFPESSSNPFKVGTTTELACAASPITLYWESPAAAFDFHNIMYTDALRTTPLTGMNFISDSIGTEIFNINSGTGEVGTTTGSGC